MQTRSSPEVSLNTGTHIVGGQQLIDREPAQCVVLVVVHDANIDFKRQPMRQHDIVRADAVSAREVVRIMVLVYANPAPPGQRNVSPEFATDDSMSVKIALIGLETFAIGRRVGVHLSDRLLCSP